MNPTRGRVLVDCLKPPFFPGENTFTEAHRSFASVIAKTDEQVRALLNEDTSHGSASSLGDASLQTDALGSDADAPSGGRPDYSRVVM